MIYCGLCQAEHTPAELVACINSTSPAPGQGDEDDD
jgi:hypothetical protein